MVADHILTWLFARSLSVQVHQRTAAVEPKYIEYVYLYWKMGGMNWITRIHWDANIRFDMNTFSNQCWNLTSSLPCRLPWQYKYFDILPQNTALIILSKPFWLVRIKMQMNIFFENFIYDIRDDRTLNLYNFRKNKIFLFIVLN